MGLFDAGANLIGTLLTNKSNEDIANQANQFSAHQYATRYQTTVKDLAKAGLSPMLAYGQGAGSAPSGAVGAPMQNPVGSALDAYLKSKERDLIDQQVDNLKKDGLIKNEQAETQKATTAKEQAAAWLNSTLRDKAQMEIEKEGVNQQWWRSSADYANLKLKRETQLLTEQIDQVAQAVITGKASAAQLNEMVEKLKSETRNLNLDAKEKEAFAQFWDHVGEGGAAAKEMLPFLKALRILIGK